MNGTLLIGRNNDNHLVVKFPNVSSKHCSIRMLEAGELLIEDLDSTNGTFVNGRRIKQCLLKPEDELSLGGYCMDVKIIIDLLGQQVLKVGVNYEDLRKQELIYQEFARLKDVYEQYQKSKRKIMKSSQLKSTGVRAGLSFIPVVGVALGILSTGVTGNVQDKLMELEEDFKRSYICPGCFKFLGAEPFENMEKRGFCMICKTKWRK